ncbi:MAG: hypothetical protein AMXMBFR53_42680 [Gemmatimonadota bacterium]
MNGLLRRIRAALGMGLTWAVAWAPIGAVLGGVLRLLLPATPVGFLSVVATNAVSFAVLGFVGGAVFSGILRLAEGNRRFDQLSLPRFAIWGAVGGLALGAAAATAGLWGGGFGLLGMGMMGAATVLGAASAAGTLAVARSAESRELSGPAGEVRDTGLTPSERRDLLGPGR